MTNPRKGFTSRRVGRFLPPLRDEFVSIEALSALALLAGAAGALAWANTGGYEQFWRDDAVLGANRREVAEWLMALFFFLVGLEIKRELVGGALRDRRAAMLPAIAALGGIAVPALIFGLVAGGSTGVDGPTLPLATDVAFAVGLLALLGRRAPAGARLFLLELAIVDDIATLLLVAVLYSGRLSASVVGVGLAMLVPLRPVRGVHVLEQVEHSLLPWVSFLIVPLFALANAGVVLDGDALSGALGSRVTLGIVAALALGKVVGIVGVTAAAQRLRIGRLPPDVRIDHVVGIGFVAGMSLTVSLFVADAALAGSALAHAKIGLLVGSLLAAALAVLAFRALARRAPSPTMHPTTGEQ